MTRALLTFVALVVLVVPSSGSTSAVYEAIPSWDDGPELTRGSTVLFFDDMESGEGGWTHVDNTAAPPRFHVDTYMAYSGGSSWWCGTFEYDANGGYGNLWDQRLTLPSIDVTGATTPVLTFVHYYDSEPLYDFTYVEAKQGGSFVAMNSGYDGQSGGWVDIGAYGYPLMTYDNPVEARLRFISDGAYSDADGYYTSVGGAYMVDNIKIYDYYGGTVYFFDDVESGGLCTPAGPGAAAGDFWHIIDRDCPAYSDSHSWWCGDDADTTLIPPNLSNSLTSPPVDISAMTEGYVYFRGHFEIPGPVGDYLQGEITTDGGATWHSQGLWYGDFGGCDGWAAYMSGGIDLGAYLPGTVFQMRFTMQTTDDGCGPGAGGGAGFMLDDFSVVSVGGPPDTWTVPGDYSTIQEAVDRAVPGDVIEVGDGVYTERVVITKSNLTLVAGSTPIIDLGRTSTTEPPVGPCILIGSTAHGTVIDGFTLRHGGNGIALNGADDCIIRNCEIYENYGDGSTDWDHGIGVYLYGSGYPLDALIENNCIHDNGEIGLLLNGAGHVITDNVICDNGELVGSYRSIGVCANYSNSLTFTGNEICGHADNPSYAGRGITVFGDTDADGHTYQYNSIHDNDYSINFQVSPVETSTLRGNAFFDNSLGMWNGTSGPVVMDAVLNWWGDASGPDAAKRGSGDPVSTGITYDPWIGKTGYEHITCSPNPLTLTGGAPTGTISVDFAGGAPAPIKGYSMKFSWDGSVATTAPVSVAEGDFSTGVGSFFHARTVGTDQILVDCAILDGAGLSASGTLFEIVFTGEVVDYSTCTVTLSDLDFRDVNNDPIAGLTVGHGEIIVDRVGPSISGVSIANSTLGHTNDFIKHGDTAVVTATVTDAHPLFSSTDIEANLICFGGSGTANPSPYDGTTATWTVVGVTCNPTDADLNVTVSSTDPYGNVGSAGSDDIEADNTRPGAVTGLDASPAHEEVVLVWDDPSGLDLHPYGVIVRYDAWGDYPFYATAAPAYPASETGGDGTALDVLSFPTGTTHAIVPRDIHYYTAFAYDWALNYGPAVTSAQDRATNYWLGDVANVANHWIPEGLVTVADIAKLSGTYAVVSPTGDNATCNVGPTDDFSRVGIPLPNDGGTPVVNFEDLMIFSMNYGVVAPRIVPLLSGMSEGVLALSIEEVGRTENGVELALMLSGNSGEVKGTSAVLEFSGAEFVSARLSEEMSSPAADVFFWSGEVEGRMLVDLSILGTDVTIGGSGELARITLTPTAGEYSVTFAEATLRNATNEDLTAELEGIEIIDEIPTVFRLVQNVPNPFNPVTTIAYHVPYESNVSIRVYDVTGRVVRTLVDGATEPGRHATVWDGRSEQGENCGSGVYFCVMETPEFRGSRKMMLLK